MAGPIALERFGPSRPEDQGARDAGLEESAAASENPDAAGLPKLDPEAERQACLERIPAARVVAPCS